jgi:hypothetical protein
MIDRQLAQFLEEGLGIHLGTCDARLQPNGVRVNAVKVEDDGLHLVVYLADIAAARVMGDLESNGQAAVSFGRPVDNRACQVKGTFAGARSAIETERPLIDAQWNGFRSNLEAVGIPRAGTGAWPTWPATAIRIRVTALFQQTPGPNAGAPLQ